MDTLLETYHSPKLNQGKKDNLNRLIIANEIEPVIKTTTRTTTCKQKFRDGGPHCRMLPNIQKEYANHFHMLQKD